MATTPGNGIPDGLVNSLTSWPIRYDNFGFYKSLVHEEPHFPEVPSVPVYDPSTGTLTVTVHGQGPFQYAWYRENEWHPLDPALYNGADTATLHVSPNTHTDQRFVVKVWRASRPEAMTFSQAVTVPRTGVTRPVIESMSPQSFVGLPLPETREIVIQGRHFPPNARLLFTDGSGVTYENRMPASATDTRITYHIATGAEAGSWTVRVVDGSNISEPHGFHVLPPVTPASPLSALVIEGPPALDEGTSAQYRARALYEDGSHRLVDAVWQRSGPASISSQGVLSAHHVNANQTVMLYASYSENGRTRTASRDILVLDLDGADGGQAVTDVIVNGDFENGKAPWTPVGYADVVELDFPRRGKGYAYLGNANDAMGAISQFVPIPVGVQKAELEFYLNVSSHETTTTIAYDTMKVDLATGSDQHVGTVAEFSNLHKREPGDYRRKRFDITHLVQAHAGESLFLIFAAQTDYADSTIFRIDDVRLLMTTEDPVELTHLTIEGPASHAENTLSVFHARAAFSDGSTQTISPNRWTVNSSLATISGNGYLQTGSVHAVTEVTVRAEYSFGGQTLVATRAVTLHPEGEEPRFERLLIEGPGSVEENQSVNLSAKALFSDGRTEAVTPQWSLTSAHAQVNAQGRVTAGEVNADRTVWVDATATLHGVTRHAEHRLRILDFYQLPALVDLLVEGPSEVWEGGYLDLQTFAKYSDGSLKHVQVEWILDEADPLIQQVGPNLFQTGYVDANTTLTIRARLQMEGQVINRNHAFLIRNVPDETGPGIYVGDLPQTVSADTAELLLSGSVSDAYRGSNGVSWLRINGQTLSGVHAQNRESVQWQHPVTLEEGENTIHIQAADHLGNLSDFTFQIIRPSPARLPAFDWVRTAAVQSGSRVSRLAVDHDGRLFQLLQFKDSIQLDGATVAGGQGHFHTVLVARNAAGDVDWLLPLTGTGHVVGEGLVRAANGDLILCGYFSESLSVAGETHHAKGTRDLFVLRLKADGRLVWFFRPEPREPSPDNYAYAMDVAVDPSGDITVGGYFRGALAHGDESVQSLADRDPFLLRLDALGAYRWLRSGQGSGRTRAYGMESNREGMLYLTGDFEGTLTWGDHTVESRGTEDIFVAALDANGAPMWLRHGGGLGANRTYGSAIHPDGLGVLIAGQMSGVEPRFHDQHFPNRPQAHAVLLHLHPNGALGGLHAMDGDHLSEAWDVTVNRKGDIHLAGYYSGTLLFRQEAWDSEGAIHGFVAAFDQNLNARDLKILTAVDRDAVLPTRLAVDWGGNVHLGASQYGAVRINGTDYEEEGFQSLLMTRMGTHTLQRPQIQPIQNGNLPPADWTCENGETWVLESTPELGHRANWTRVGEESSEAGNAVFYRYRLE
ncbi:MAG: hypothetical protein JJU29_01865 [Verrucomicrobia bacterium]|nr:hypothetical protein [Verrucomicrobiota bacterium]MCH8510979.1 hypothetical protein [Kiritimatiellia bacterium]